MVASEGFEPSPRASETLVLPIRRQGSELCKLKMATEQGIGPRLDGSKPSLLPLEDSVIMSDYSESLKILQIVDREQPIILAISA